jgi:hypothetical protein
MTGRFYLDVANIAGHVLLSFAVPEQRVGGHQDVWLKRSYFEH